MVRKTGNVYADTEIGTIRKNWSGKISIALVYPNFYGVGMSNLGFQSIYQLLNSFDDVVCERAFLPDSEKVQKHKRETHITSLESGRPLTDFQIVAFSISFENDFPNVLTIINKVGLPLQSNARGDSHPLLIAGGVACFLNPEPINSFIDCFLIGEGESLFGPFLDQFKKEHNRNTCLLNISKNVPGAYVPGFYTASYKSDGTLLSFTPTRDVPEKIKRVYLEDLSNVPTHSAVVSSESAFDSAWLVEVSRGCQHGCRFCSAGYVYRPPRFRSADLLRNCISQGASVTDRIGLVGTAISDYPEIGKICTDFHNDKVRFSFSSLRADAISKEHISVLQKSGTRTATIAPDAGSERMRRVINKGITEENILMATDQLVTAGVPNLKVYFMIGLPGETAEDIDETIRLCKKIKTVFLEASRKKGRMGQITVSISSFVPKPFTPFQWVAMDTVKVLKKKIKTINNGLRQVANVSVNADSPRWSYIQALLSRGDRRVSQLLGMAFENDGNWVKTFKESAMDPGFYIHRERETDELLPWDFIDHGINKSFLANEYKRALLSKTSPACPMVNCTACGVCKKPPHSTDSSS